MSDGNWLKNFFKNFGKVPEEEPKELIPHDIRIPVFLGIVVVSLVLLALLLWLVVIPAINAQSAHAQAPTRSMTSLAPAGPKEIT